MIFVSYAQNCEDVVLWRALQHVKHGFYIDVGANDPSEDSVTKAFYERGWHGINIEPLTQHYEDLVVNRPRDINLQVAAGSKIGEIEIWECDIRGWATADKNSVLSHTEAGNTGRYHKVQQQRLADICQNYAPRDIHFLKVDVEGFEKSVLEGMDFSQFRPWVLVIEATRPNSTEENYHEWEPLVVSFGYKLAYADGLNRFYVSSEHEELFTSLKYPPNVFDNFRLASQVQADSYITSLATRVEELKRIASVADARAVQADGRAEQAHIRAQQAISRADQLDEIANLHLNQLKSVYASTSWKITRPFRGMMRLLTGNYSRSISSNNAIATETQQRGQEVGETASASISKDNEKKDMDFDLSSHSTQVYFELKKAIELHKDHEKK